MLNFESDYTTGCCPEILEKLIETNLKAQTGYGDDEYCKSAEEKIKKFCNAPDAQVEFIVGGTQTNQVVISSMLQRWQGVIAVQTGHINCHEAGAIEYTGHKVLTLPHTLGKINAADIQTLITSYNTDTSNAHMVQPAMVYISHPTEYGTLYSLPELTAISNVCRANNLILYLDGARLGYGLASYHTDVTISDIAKLCDIFYIGGTKVGALCGEAVVFPHANRPAHFLTMKKQNGALLAKGRLLGIQFDTLFTNQLYLTLSRHAIDAAERLKRILSAAGLPFLLDSPTNQQFIILNTESIANISRHVKFCFWEKIDSDHTAVRFATSWSTSSSDLDVLSSILSKYL